MFIIYSVLDFYNKFNKNISKQIKADKKKWVADKTKILKVYKT